MKRARGKPKGHKDASTGHVVVSKVDLHRARAEREFLHALNVLLPVKAFDKLSQIAPERVTNWAIEWHINCPCVLEAARSLASLAQAWRADARGKIPQELRSLLRSFGDSYRGAPVRDIWLKELARLYRLTPVEPSARVAIASEQELRDQDLAWAASIVPVPNAELMRTRAGLEKARADRERADVQVLVQAAQADSRRAQANAFARDDVLAPPLTDGMESLQEYLAVASTYWTAMRAQFLKIIGDARMKVHVVRPLPDLARDACWVARCRVGHNTRPASIAKEDNVEVRAIEKAIKQFERRIQLTPRHRRGRPRKSAIR
jgi:hypothetical protein